eukprot:jgi/Ulvmu1/5634/UM023_0174.1
MDQMQRLLARGAAEGAARIAGDHTLLMPPEAERMVQDLRVFGIHDIGTRVWFQQQAWTEKLNLQSHANARAHAADFVQEYIVSHDKVTTLVHELLIMEVWKENLLPLLTNHLSQNVDSVSAYMLLFHEANVANLLEMVFFDDQAFEAIAEDYAVELVDWCARQLCYLHGQAFEDTKPLELSCQELIDRSEAHLFDDRIKEIRFGVAICSVTILRYMTGAVTRLPISIVTRLVQHHDTIGMLVPLLEGPPWIRDRNGTTERREGTQWTVIAPSDRFQLSSIDAQVWLALTNLVVDPSFRAKYRLDNFRKDTLNRIRRFLNDLLIDQLPVLQDLQRVVDEVALNYRPNFDDYDDGALVIEQIPQVRISLLNQDWKQLAATARTGWLSEQALLSAAQDRVTSMLAALDFLAEWEGPVSSRDKEPSASLQDVPVKVTMYERTSTGVMAPWSTLELRIDPSIDSVPVSIKGESGMTVHGDRWTLKPLPSTMKVLPTRGRVAVCVGDSTAQALLELPCTTSKDAEEMAAIPTGVWVTVGLLAQDEFALQLRLKRTPKAAVRNKEAGIWNMYCPVGGALTIFKQAESEKENAQPARVVMELD